MVPARDSIGEAEADAKANERLKKMVAKVCILM